MSLNTQAINSRPINSASINVDPFIDWTLDAPVERQTVYVLDIGTLRIPISSAQATMRKTGQSFLQAVVPGGDSYVDELATLTNDPMILRTGYRYADGSFSPLEPIAEAPFEQLRRDEGARSDTLTLSGYGTRSTTTTLTRALPGVRYRSTGTDGRRRTRCDIELFLRPGHTAKDSDGVEFTVGVIQYFINASSESMEVLQDG